MMGISKYKKSLYLIGGLSALIIIIFLFLEPIRGDQDISQFIPGKGFIETILLLLFIWPIGAIIGGFLFGYILSPLFLFIHKKTIGFSMDYGIQENLKSQKFKSMNKGIFPALLAINFSLMFALNSDIAEVVVYNIGDISNMPSTVNIIAFLIILSITIIIGMGLFSPVWFLNDAGIVYSNQEKVRKKQLEQPIIGRSVGGWYMNLMKGYAGIAVIFSYYKLISQFLTEMTGVMLIPNLILFLPMMFLISIAAIPAFILLDLTKEHRNKYIRKWAEKFGITKKVAISFQENS